MSIGGSTNDTNILKPPAIGNGSMEYLRRVQLIVGNDQGGIDLSNLHIKFSVRQFTMQTNNVAEIRVFNLDDATASQIDAEFSDLTLNAGYEGGDFETIFDGTIVQVRHGWESAADKYIDITAQDGDLATNYEIVRSAMAKGSTLEQRIQVLAKAMGVTVPADGIPPDAQLPQDAQQALPRGKTMFIKASEAMRDTAMHAMCTWSVQNGQLVLVPYDGYLDREVVQINAATGMIGWPEQSQEGIQVKCLLNPRLVIGGRIQLNNREILISELNIAKDTYVEQNAPGLARALLDMDGFYKLIVIEHQGDTRGTEYYSSLLCIAVSQQVVPPGVVSKGYNFI